MGILFSALRDKIYRMLDDPTGEGFSEDLLKDGIHAALDAILPWVPMRATVTLAVTSGSNGNMEYALPDDCYGIEGVYDIDGVPIRYARLDPEMYRGDASQEQDWIEYPIGHLLFSKEVTDDLTVFYVAYWPKPTTSNSYIAVPNHLVTALSLYATAYSLIPGGISSATIRQFNQRVDSGTPEDNPLGTRVEKLLRLFEIEMNRYPPHLRATRA